jgi:hypothetical protein
LIEEHFELLSSVPSFVHLNPVQVLISSFFQITINIIHPSLSWSYLLLVHYMLCVSHPALFVLVFGEYKFGSS